jgi:hypothetical protein
LGAALSSKVNITQATKSKKPLTVKQRGKCPVPELTLEQNENILSGFPLFMVFHMSSSANPQSDADQLEAAADQAIAACGGDAREAVKALIVANHYLETGKTKGCGLDGLCARKTDRGS